MYGDLSKRGVVEYHARWRTLEPTPRMGASIDTLHGTFEQFACDIRHGAACVTAPVHRPVPVQNGIVRPVGSQTLPACAAIPAAETRLPPCPPAEPPVRLEHGVARGPIARGLPSLPRCGSCLPAPQPIPAETGIATLMNPAFVPAHDEGELSLGVKLLFESGVYTLPDEGRAAVSEVADNAAAAGRAQNRRVVIAVQAN